MAFEKIAVDSPFVVTLLPEADTAYEVWVERLSENSSKEIGIVLKSYFPQRLANAILAELHVPSNVPVNKELVQKIARFLSG